MRKILLGLALLITSALSANAANRFAVCTATCTWDASSTAMWSTTTGGATGASVPTTGDAVIFDGATCVGGVTCTTTVNTTVTVDSITSGACTAATSGCVIDFSANNNNVNINFFSSSGTGTRNIKCGSGTWTFSGGFTSSVLNFQTSTNLTTTCASAAFVFSATGTNNSRQIFLGTQSIGSVSIAESVVARIFTINNGGTISSLSITPPLSLELETSVTLTISNAFTLVGTAFNNAISLSGGSGVPTVATVSIASGTATCTWCALRRLTFTGGATFTASNSLNLQSNTGITITGPSGGATGGSVIGGF